MSLSSKKDFRINPIDMSNIITKTGDEDAKGDKENSKKKQKNQHSLTDTKINKLVSKDIFYLVNYLLKKGILKVYIIKWFGSMNELIANSLLQESIEKSAVNRYMQTLLQIAHLRKIVDKLLPNHERKRSSFKTAKKGKKLPISIRNKLF